MANNLIKIFLSYHDKHELIKSEILTPIQTGCANAKELFQGMLHDNDGVNISKDNVRYNELSAQYFVYKNYDKIGNPDFVGFMHYRRHFMFDGYLGDPNFKWLKNGEVFFVPYLTDKYLSHFSDELIKDFVPKYDCITIAPYDVKNIDSKNLREQYGKLLAQNIENFDVLISSIKSCFPEYSKEADMLSQGSKQYLCNMFIMSKELFMEYSNFCFKVLEDVDQKIDSSKMNELESRFLGFFGEFLLSAFMFHIKERKDLKITTLPASYVLEVKFQEESENKKFKIKEKNMNEIINEKNLRKIFPGNRLLILQAL